MTDTRVNLGGRFRLAPDEELEDWCGRIAADDADRPDLWIGVTWDPREVEEEANVDLLVQAAVEDGIISSPDGMAVNFVYDGSSYWFTVDIGRRVVELVTIDAYGYEMRKLVGEGIVGAEAAASILAEAVYAANSALDRLQRLVAASYGENEGDV